MASSDEPSPSPSPPSSLSTPSSDTALCIIPPRHLWEPVDRLRSLHDKGYNRWPPHINLVYPFVSVDCLPGAVDAIRELDLSSIVSPGSNIVLSDADTFNHKQYNTLHLRPAPGSDAEDVLQQLARSLRVALGRPANEKFTPHMTIAQSYDAQCAAHHYLMDKVRSLTGLSWDITELAVLVRDRGGSNDAITPGSMRVWGYIDVSPVQVRRLPKAEILYPAVQDDSSTGVKSVPQLTYHFSDTDRKWITRTTSEATSALEAPAVSLDRLIVASYNVLGEFEWPPNQERYPNLVSHLVSDRGLADILVLEEATDHFLQYLLAEDRIRARYPYSTHGPSNQVEIGPLPNHLNVVVLSRFELQWSHLPFQRRHKGAAIVTFPSLNTVATTHHESKELPLVLAACHLTHGLVDGAVICKKNEVSRLLDHLASTFGSHPQIIAGDFNMPTSSYTIDMARKTRHISSESYRYLRDFDSMLANAGLQDAWLASRIQSGESSASASLETQDTSEKHYEGEQGATFDPLSNRLAARLVGDGLNKRPQRYDRILVNGRLGLRPSRFNMFGLERSGDDVGASDHWGIRCLLTPRQEHIDSRSDAYIRSIKLQKSPASLGGLEQLQGLLHERELLPSKKDATERLDAIHLLARVLECQIEGQAKVDNTKGKAQFVMAPVGSYGLGVWTQASDLDLLCIGSISHKTFMKLAVTRLRKVATDGITIIRKVKASTGTMLLLDVNGISVDLHYCGASRILQEFPNVLNRPPTDPVFSLPVHTLYKLKPLRDVSYLRRSIPDMAQYRVAHLFIKAWTKSRGLYGPKFGLLGGIHITALLVPVVKMLANDVGSVSVGDIIATFFHHYAHVDWKTQIILDPFFHGTGINHRRLEREPMCLLGWHAPALNTALNASAPTVHTISTEMLRANALLSQENITWDKFLGAQTADQGATDFLKSHKRYAKIYLNYWGSSSQKRNEFVGWLESRCVMLLVDLDRKVPSLTARIWPQRFIDSRDTKNTEPNSGESLEYHGCYLIGLDWVSSLVSKSAEGGEDASLNNLHHALALFSDRIRGDEIHYDSNTSWIGASVIKGDLTNLEPDHSQVGENAGDGGFDDDFDSDDEEDEDEEAEEEDINQQLPSRPKIGSQHTQSTQSPKASTGKLRTSTDVMNRIRWDPNLDSSDFIVGYDDRFTGIQEKKFEEWKSELTDEEFIPQHRVMYFKRKSDGEIVWDRRQRVDKIFGNEGLE